MTADDLRTQLAENEAATAALAPGDYSGRFTLEKKGDELRTRLHDLIADELDEASAEWAARAGRKGEHEQPDPEVYAATMLINPPATGP